MKGDVNGNGAVDNTDVTQVKATYLERRTLSAEAYFAADVNNNEEADNTDVTQIKATALERRSLNWL